MILLDDVVVASKDIVLVINIKAGSWGSRERVLGVGC